MQINDQEELQLIKETLKNYVEAFKEWNIEKLVKAVHPEAMTVWYVPERGGFISVLCYGWIRSFIQNQKDDPGMTIFPTIEEIDQIGTAAYARFRLLIEDGENTRDTTDYLTLLKFKESWNIINKSGYNVNVSLEELQKIKEEKLPSKRNDPGEIKSIKEVLSAYTQAFDEWDIEKIKQSFHPEMRVNGINSETGKFWNYFRPYCMWQESFKAHKERNVTFETRVEKIDQLGTAAVARLWWKAFLHNGTAITIDYLTLLKIEGQWRIVNKTCYIERDLVEE